MAALRFISALIECAAAVYILHRFQVKEALRVNALLGLVGPLILIFVTLVGVVGIADKLSFGRLGLILLAVLLIFAATR